MAGIGATIGAVGGAAAVQTIARARRACSTPWTAEFAPARDRQAARAVERTRRSFGHRRRCLAFSPLLGNAKSGPLAQEASGKRQGCRVTLREGGPSPAPSNRAARAFASLRLSR